MQIHRLAQDATGVSMYVVNSKGGSGLHEAVAGDCMLACVQVKGYAVKATKWHPLSLVWCCSVWTTLYTSKQLVLVYVL